MIDPESEELKLRSDIKISYEYKKEFENWRKNLKEINNESSVKKSKTFNFLH